MWVIRVYVLGYLLDLEVRVRIRQRLSFPKQLLELSRFIMRVDERTLRTVEYLLEPRLEFLEDEEVDGCDLLHSDSC